MLENDKPANEKIAKHIDRCLSCYACMTTCPSGVNYMHLVDHARNHIEKTFTRPFFDRFIRSLLSKILPSPTLFRIAGYSARLFYPFRFLFPKKIKNMMKYMPNSFPVSRQENKEIYSPVGKTYARVALLTGCVQRVISPQINDATKAMTKLGWKPKYDLATLVKEMVASDLEIFKKELLLKKNGYTTSKESE